MKKNLSSWNPIWDTIYEQREWGKYPIEELIRFVARNFYHVKNRSDVHFLDLGSGYGAATWYLAREGFQVTSIDGSKVICNLLKKRLVSESLTSQICSGDVISLPFKDQSFDCVVDIACLMCNNYSKSNKILKEIYRILKRDGRIYSYTPQLGSWGDGIGTPVGHNTFENPPTGPFANMGVVRFSPYNDILKLYSEYDQLMIDYHHRTFNNQENCVAFWSISGIKKLINEGI